MASVVSLVKSHGAVAELVVHLHHRRAGSEGEYLCFGKHLARQLENALLYALGKSYAAIFVGNDKSGVGDKPCLLLQHSI